MAVSHCIALKTQTIINCVVKQKKILRRHLLLMGNINTQLVVYAYE